MSRPQQPVFDRVDGVDDARQYLKNQWRNAEGDVRCPHCNATAQDWEQHQRLLFIKCPDCGNVERCYF